MNDKWINPKKLGTIEEINSLRGLGALAVMAIHTAAHFTEAQSFNLLVLTNLWLDIAFQFAVPLFILISGFVLSKNYYDDFSFKDFYIKRLRSILPQYTLFSVLYTLFVNWEAMKSNPLNINITLVIKNILQFSAADHLWYFSLIIQFYITYPILIKIYKFFKLKGKVELLLAVLLMIQILWMAGTLSPYSDSIKINFIAYLFYFGLGIYSCDHYDQLKNRINHLTPLLVAASFALVMGSSYPIIIGLTTGFRFNDIPLYYLIGSEIVYPILRISTFMLLFNMASSLIGKRSFLTKAVNKIGEYSFGIYLIHMFFNKYAIRLLKNHSVDYNNWLFYPTVFIVTVILSYLSVRLISYIPYSYYIIGYRNKRKTFNKV